MGGDDSQKLLPWRGIHSPPGRKPPAPVRNQHSTQRVIWLVGVSPTFCLFGASELKTMQVLVTDGDLLDQPVEVIVNAWNRNIIPWWLLLPRGNQAVL